MNDKILNIKELAEYINCSEAFIRKLIYTNKIPYFRIGKKILFKLSKIEDWIKINENL